MRLNHRLRATLEGGWLHCAACGRKVSARTAYSAVRGYYTRFSHVRPYEPGMVTQD